MPKDKAAYVREDEIEGGGWIGGLRRYFLVSAGLHLVWEVAHLPLYTLWQTGSTREQAVAILHCTGGDILIAAASLLCALMLVGRRGWPSEAIGRVAVVTITVGIGYTIYSEWLNTSVRSSWTYSELMPVLPWLGTGLSPLAQWIVVPTLALWAAGRRPSDFGSNSEITASKEQV